MMATMIAICTVPGSPKFSQKLDVLMNLQSKFLPAFYVLLYSACVLVDVSGKAIALTLYNLAQTTHFSVGDIITVPDPLFRHVIVQNDVSLSLNHTYGMARVVYSNTVCTQFYPQQFLWLFLHVRHVFHRSGVFTVRVFWCSGVAPFWCSSVRVMHRSGVLVFLCSGVVRASKFCF